jgi:SulP family sulfate permease
MLGIGENEVSPAESMREYARSFARPLEIVRSYRKRYIRPDVVAGATVAVLAIPQCIAYAAIAGLPPTYGLYSAVVATIAGALWGSSRHLSTGPTNAISILVLSILTPLAAIGAPEYLVAASAMAIMVGVLCIVFGFARLGMLVNFASRSVLLGFTAGAGVLIAVGQLRNLLNIDIPRGPHLPKTLLDIASNIDQLHLTSVVLGGVTVLIILLIDGFTRRLPGAILALVSTGAVVAALGVERLGIAVVGEVPRAMPRVTEFSLGWMFERDIFSALLMGALAVAALGLVEAISIAREIARQSGEHLDVNQELIGQGMANITAGIFSGYASSGSFTRSAVNFQTGARSQMSSVFCGLFILAGVLAFGPLAAYLPRASLAGLIMLIAYRMVDWRGVRRVMRGSRSETGIMVSTFVATLVLPLEFAVLAGVILSLAIYIYKSSMPRIESVVPDENFHQFVVNPGAPVCPQLGIIKIEGSLFFGAATHVEDALLANREAYPGQTVLLLRMHGVDRCDLSGIDVLEGILRIYRGTGGDLYLTNVRPGVRDFMRRTGFEHILGSDRFLEPDDAVEYLFNEVIDSAVCCYECEHRVFAECQPLVKHPYDGRLPTSTGHLLFPLKHLKVAEFEDAVAEAGDRSLLIDVREPEEYELGHLPNSRLLPLRDILGAVEDFPRDRPIFLVSRSGRRSTRAMRLFVDVGYEEVFNLKGGILSWKARGRPLEVE